MTCSKAICASPFPASDNCIDARLPEPPSHNTFARPSPPPSWLLIVQFLNAFSSFAYLRRQYFWLPLSHLIALPIVAVVWNWFSHIRFYSLAFVLVLTRLIRDNLSCSMASISKPTENAAVWKYRMTGTSRGVFECTCRGVTNINSLYTYYNLMCTRWEEKNLTQDINV